MRKILKVAQREYVEMVKTKTFLLGLLVTPIMVGLIMFFMGPAGRGGKKSHPPRIIAVTDLSSELASEIKAAFDAHNTSHPKRQILPQERQVDQADFNAHADQQKDKVRQGALDAYVVLDEDVVAGAGKMRIYLRGTRPTHLDFFSALQNLLNRAIVNRRCKLRNVSPKLLSELRRRVPAVQVDVGPTPQQERSRSQQDRIVAIVVPFFFPFTMFIGIFVMSQHMLTSVIEEKNSRVIEVLLSAVSPFQLMTGKIIGLAGIGLTVITLWAVGAFLAARWQGLELPLPVEIVPYFVIYYILGFLLFSSVLAGIGSICNTMKEAQSLMFPVSLIGVLPILCWSSIVRHPEGTLARVLSFIPPLTPMVMITRLAASSDLYAIEILASLVLLAAAVLAVVWLAARVFRTGILMYGKRPRLAELLRCLRQK